MRPATELRKAAAVLRCDHSFSVDRPHSVFAPAPCGDCGVPWPGDLVSPEHLKEPLAAWLARAGDIAAYAEARGYRTATQTAQVLPEAALAVARVVLGTPPTPTP